MARDEQDREDFLAEATALVERAELLVAGEAEPVTIGFRRNDAASVFFGGDAAYHFKPSGELRRAFRQGLLYKAERPKLVSLERRRLPGQVQLVRRELCDDEARAFLGELSRRLESLRSALSEGRCQLVGQIPQASDVVGRIRGWLEKLSLPPAVAETPGLGK